jgi:hypothetical protein
MLLFSHGVLNFIPVADLVPASVGIVFTDWSPRVLHGRSAVIAG